MYQKCKEKMKKMVDSALLMGYNISVSSCFHAIDALSKKREAEKGGGAVA